MSGKDENTQTSGSLMKDEQLNSKAKVTNCDGESPETVKSKKSFVSKLPRPRSFGSEVNDSVVTPPADSLEGDASDCNETPEVIQECNGGNSSGPIVKDTIASKKRYSLVHGLCEGGAHNAVDYVTPLQRKEQQIKELKAQVRDLQKVVEQKESWCQEQLDKKQHDTEQELRENRERVEQLTTEIEALRLNLKDGCEGAEETRETIACLHLTIKKLQEEIDKKEKQHQQLYLEMYLKGKNAANFERMEELERLASRNPQSVTVRELLEKLMNTEHELEKWQTIKRDESYQSFELPKTEPEVTLSFLKDAMLHYLTDAKDRDEHLRAIIQIFDYSDIEKEKIRAAMVARKKKGK